MLCDQLQLLLRRLQIPIHAFLCLLEGHSGFHTECIVQRIHTIQIEQRSRYRLLQNRLHGIILCSGNVDIIQRILQVIYLVRARLLHGFLMLLQILFIHIRPKLSDLLLDVPDGHDPFFLIRRDLDLTVRTLSFLDVCLFLFKIMCR